VQNRWSAELFIARSRRDRGTVRPRLSASTICQINKGLDGALTRFVGWPLQEAYPYLIMDARHDKVRIDGVRIPLIADTHSRLIADSVPGDRGHPGWGA
jgi:hypothetical protein